MFSAINLTLYITKIDIVKYSKLHSRALTCFSLMHNNIEVVTRVKLKKPWLAQLEVIKCQTDINCSHSLKQTFGYYSSIKKKKRVSLLLSKKTKFTTMNSLFSWLALLPQKWVGDKLWDSEDRDHRSSGCCYWNYAIARRETDANWEGGKRGSQIC